MTIQQYMTTSFKTEILDGIHAVGTAVVRASSTPDVFKIALYTSAATLDYTTTVYTTAGEVVGTGYTAGGVVLTVAVPPTGSGTTAYMGFNNASWPASSLTARGALIYNSSQGNRSVAVLDFGADKTSASNTFLIQFPSSDATNAVIRII